MASAVGLGHAVLLLSSLVISGSAIASEAESAEQCEPFGAGLGQTSSQVAEPRQGQRAPIALMQASARQHQVRSGVEEPRASTVHREVALDKELQSSLVAPNACEWTVHYDKWVPSFDKGEYDHIASLGSAHCFYACCRDPTCIGLAMESSEKYQCYKYSSMPKGLDEHQGRPLADGQWMLQKKTAWSIFLKGRQGVAPVLPTQRYPQLQPEASAPALGATSLGSHTGAGPLLPVGHEACGWTVHYDSWMSSFDPGEYRHPGASGGEHCLVACCKDPTCLGIALESIEKYQCYKYSHVPHGLERSKGQPLGDGKWLTSRRPAWSIFMKSGAEGAQVVLPEAAQGRPSEVVTGGPPAIAQVGALIAVLFFFAICYNSDSGPRRLAAKLGLRHPSPEGRKLLGA